MRPESCTRLAGESPVRVSAGAPGSRLQLRGVILGVTAERQEPRRWEQGSGPQPSQVNAAASSDSQPKGVREGRAAHVTAKAIDNVLLIRVDTGPLRGICGGTLPQLCAEQERPYPTARKAKTGSIRPKAEISQSREGVRGVRSTDEGGEKPLEGRDSASVVTGFGVSVRACLDQIQANNPEEQSARTRQPSMVDRQVVQWTMHAAAGRPSVSRVLEICTHGLNGRIRKPESPLAAIGA